MRPFHAAGGPGELLARASFLEPLVAGRRVLELGGAAASGGLSSRALALLGAAHVLACDPDVAGLALAAEGSSHPAVEYRALAGDALPEGPFDLVVVHDGAPLAAAPERIAALAALLAPGGWLAAVLPVAGAPSLAALAGETLLEEAPEYESFVSCLEVVFPVVEVATQSAVVGWVLGTAAADGPELLIDGAHGGLPTATSYLAICGEAPSLLVGMVLVPLPAAAALRDTAARSARSALWEAAGLDDALAEARVGEAATAARAEAAERRGAELGEDLARSGAAVEEGALRARALEAELFATRARVAEGEAALAAAREGEEERARERDEARREALVSARESRSWGDAQARVEQRLAELEALVASQAQDLETAQGVAARAVAEAGEARARAEEARYEADVALRRVEGAEAELRRLTPDLTEVLREAERLRAELAGARERAAGTTEG